MIFLKETRTDEQLIGGVCIALGLLNLGIRLFYPSSLILGSTKIQLPRIIPGRSITIPIDSFLGYGTRRLKQDSEVYFQLTNGETFRYKESTIKDWEKFLIEVTIRLPCLDEAPKPMSVASIKLAKVILGLGSIGFGVACFFPEDIKYKMILGVSSILCLALIQGFKNPK